MSYLERYLNGEYQQVWNELIALGTTVYQDPLYTDAYAVAREIMKRVRQNLEMLVQDLIADGFLFGYDHLLQLVLQNIRSDQDWHDYNEMLAWVKEQAPVLSPQHWQVEPFDIGNMEEIAAELQKKLGRELDPEPPIPSRHEYVEMVSQSIGPWPLSLQAWYEEVGGVNLYGYHPLWNACYREQQQTPYLQKSSSYYLMSACDPLMVVPLDQPLIDRLLKEYARKGYASFEFAEDHDFKNYCAGGPPPYVFNLPDAHADISLLGLSYTDKQGNPITFVDYLRLCFQWAGFPGMSLWNPPPEELVAPLTKTLLPF